MLELANGEPGSPASRSETSHSPGVGRTPASHWPTQRPTLGGVAQSGAAMTVAIWRLLLAWRFGGYTLTELGCLVGVSYAAVAKTEHRIIHSLATRKLYNQFMRYLQTSSLRNLPF
jgi:hypothetical protein